MGIPGNPGKKREFLKFFGTFGNCGNYGWFFGKVEVFRVILWELWESLGIDFTGL